MVADIIDHDYVFSCVVSQLTDDILLVGVDRDGVLVDDQLDLLLRLEDPEEDSGLGDVTRAMFPSFNVDFKPDK